MYTITVLLFSNHYSLYIIVLTLTDLWTVGIYIFSHLYLCLAAAIHNLKWVTLTDNVWLRK